MKASMAVFGGVLLSASTLRAQEPLPSGTLGDKPATSGTTDVANGGSFETAAPKPKEDGKEETKDKVEAQIQAGGLLSTGNARSLAATASGNFRARRNLDQFSAVAAANYGRAAADADTDTKTTVENYQGKIRYDRFLTEDFAVFLAASGRRDRFQQLDMRLNIDPGVAYYFVDKASRQLWGELGYDFQFDVRRQEAIDLAAAAAAAGEGEPLDKTEARHSGRVFVGYHDAVNEAVTLTTGLEYLQGLTESKNYRINWDAGITSKIGGNFSLATTFSLKYDHNPLPGVKQTDTVTAVSLVYQLL